MEIIEGNKIIAEFYGITYEIVDTKSNYPEGEHEYFVRLPSGACFKQYGNLDDIITYCGLKYHASWDWLHGAWDKFKSIQLKEWEGDGTKWNHAYSFYLSKIGNAMTHLTILDTFNELVSAIQWQQSTV